MTLIHKFEGRELRVVCEAPSRWFRNWGGCEYYRVDVTPPMRDLSVAVLPDVPVKCEFDVATFKLVEALPGPRHVVVCVENLDKVLAHPEVKPWEN